MRFPLFLRVAGESAAVLVPLTLSYGAEKFAAFSIYFNSSAVLCNAAEISRTSAARPHFDSPANKNASAAFSAFATLKRASSVNSR